MKKAKKGIPHYENKWNYLVKKHTNLCPIAWDRGNMRAQVEDLHHLCHPSEWRRRSFPLFLNSLLNLRPVNHSWHLKFGSWGKIHDLKAQQYERFLERHPAIAEWVNSPGEYYE